MQKSTYTIDERIKVIRSTVDNWILDFYVTPRTVSKGPPEILTNDTNLMQKVLNECSRTVAAIDMLEEGLRKAKEFSEDLDVEIKSAYEITGIEMPSVDELLNEIEIGVETDEEDEEVTETSEKLNESDQTESPEINGDTFNSKVCFYTPTPAKSKSSMKRLHL